jgi:hypothetical protein
LSALQEPLARQSESDKLWHSYNEDFRRGCGEDRCHVTIRALIYVKHRVIDHRLSRRYDTTWIFDHPAHFAKLKFS